MVGCFEKNRKIIRGKAFEQKKKKPGLKFIPRLALSQSSKNYTLVSTFFSLSLGSIPKLFKLVRVAVTNFTAPPNITIEARQKRED